MLADDEEIEVKPAVAYVDAVLANNTRVYRRVVRYLHRRGMVTLCPEPKEYVGMFLRY